MKYPFGFPSESCAAVTAERLRAGRLYDIARNSLALSGSRSRLIGELQRYILRPFLAFVKEASKLGVCGVWDVDRVEQESIEFLRLMTIEAVYKKGQDRAGRSFAPDWTDGYGGLRPEVMRQIERSEEWQQFQEILLNVAESQSAARCESAGQSTHNVVSGHSSSAPETAADNVEQDEPGASMPAADAIYRSSDRLKIVDDFVDRCNRMLGAGSRIAKKHIWLAAGYTNARQFQYWQAGKQKVTESAERNFGLILAMKPADFCALLKERGIMK